MANDPPTPAEIRSWFAASLSSDRNEMQAEGAALPPKASGALEQYKLLVTLTHFDHTRWIDNYTAAEVRAPDFAYRTYYDIW